MDKPEFEKMETINLVIKQEENRKKEITLKEILKSLRGGIRFITIFTAAAFLLSLLAATIYMLTSLHSTGQMKALIAFNYDGIDKGLDPHGMVFDIDKLKAPVVVDRVMENLRLYDKKLTTEDIRSNIDIQSMVPDDIIKKITTINRMAEKDVTKLEQLSELEYHPTQFLVSFSNERRLGLTRTEAGRVLNELLKEYRLYFMQTYGDKDVLSGAVGDPDYSGYDYPEMARAMKGQIDIITSYLKDKQKKSPEFRSISTQMSFGDIISYLNVINDVDISRMNSLIYNFNLTKDKNRLLSLYQYRIEQYGLEMAKRQDESKLAQDSVNRYQKDKNLVLLPETNGETAGAMEFDSKNKYYDQLIERALNSGVSAAGYAHDIEYYKQVIGRLNNDQVTADVKQKYVEEVGKMVDSITEKLKNWVDITNKTVDEYYETEVFTNAVKIPIPAEYESSVMSSLKLPLLAVLAVTVLAAFAAILLVLFKGAVSRNNIAGAL